VSRFDSKVIDGAIHTTARATVRTSKDSGWVDLRIVDGLVNLLARTFYGLGSLLRGVQTGYLRSYVVFLVVAAIAIWVLLAALLGAPAATTK
jgi:NADH-quinone oxidoreductase subunit L